MRVLHVLEAGAAGWTGVAACLSATRAAIPGVEQRVAVLGGGDAARMIERAGGAGDVVIPAGAGARSALRAGDADVLHAWSDGAARLCLDSAPARVRVCATALAPAREPSTRTAGLEIRALAGPRSRLLDGAVATHLGSLTGWPIGPEARRRAESERAAPPIDPARIDPGMRSALREAWGIEDGRTVVALVGDPPDACEARRFAFIVGVLGVAGRRIAGVCPRGAHAGERAARFVERLGHPWPLAFVGAPTWEWIAGVDVAVWLNNDAERAGSTRAVCAPWAARWALAGRARLVCERSAAAESACVGLPGARIVEPGSLNVAAGALEAIAEARGAWTLDARAEAAAWSRAHGLAWAAIAGASAGTVAGWSPAPAEAPSLAARS